MIREFHSADWFTLGNAVCGTAAMFATIFDASGSSMISRMPVPKP